MPTREPESTGWKRVLTGLGYVRRGSVLVVASGLLLLLLGSVGRAGCANPNLPEVRGLMQYQSLVFYAALLLGFVMVVGGQLQVALLPGTWKQRALPLGLGALAATAMVVMAAQAAPGKIAPINSPPGGAGILVAAVLGTTALAGSALLVMLVARRLGGEQLLRSAAIFAVAMVAAVAANAEASAGLLFPDPVQSLYAIAGVAAVDLVALGWMYSLLQRSETLVRERIE